MIVQEFESTFTLLPDTEHVYYQWRSLVTTHEVKGLKVYDARLVALMRVYGIQHILTLKGSSHIPSGRSNKLSSCRPVPKGEWIS